MPATTSVRTCHTAAGHRRTPSSRQPCQPAAAAPKQKAEWAAPPGTSGGASGSSRQRSASRSGGCRAGAARAAGEGGPDVEALGRGSGPGGEQQPQQQFRQQQRGRRPRRGGLQREDLPFFIARADLSWKQPWRFEQTAPLAELQLRGQGVAGLDDTAAAAANTPHASARFKVQAPQGLGALVLAGEAQAAVPLRCELCGTGFITEVREPFDAVVYIGDGSGGDGSAVGGGEVAFGLDDQFCDITPLVVDAIVAALPSVCQCGGGSCLQHAGREVVWVSTPAADAPPASSPFAKLLSGAQK